jgi:hypothetical protein
MKKQSRRARATSAPPIPVRHQLDHVVPTVIQHPEEKMTALARLTQRVFKDPRRFATWALAIVVTVLAVVVLTNLTSGGRSRTTEAWSKLESAKKADERVDIAKGYPGSPAALWALLQAATEYFDLGMRDLPNNRDVALPNFKKAIGLFDQVAREAPKDSFQARAAALGKARALEASNDLPKAIEQYDLVAKSWPGSPEAEQAKKFGEVLKKPDAIAFYKELYSYSPPKFTLPPLGTEDLKFPLPGSLGAPSRFGPAEKPSPLTTMPLELAPPSDVTKSPAAEKRELPADVFTPAPAAPRPAPKAPR